MAFFDVGINVNVNIGQSVANVNSLIASMQRLQTMGNIGTQAAAGLNSLNQSLVQTGNTAQQTGQKMAVLQNFFQVFRSDGAQAASTLSNLRQGFSATLGPVEQLGAGMNQLRSTFSATVAPINQGGNALRQFSGQLQQTGTAMNNTATSGNRLAEIFRGNRGLVFGASAFFGTLTGIAFELQLVNDANGQVADSQGKLNQLMAEGKQGSAQYSQAQQALAKDQRFLEFSTRNLALAFTNLIPDTILIVNGVLGLRDKLSSVPSAAVGASNALRAASTEMKVLTTETVAARDALASFNLVSAAGGGVGGKVGGGILGGILGIATGPIGIAAAAITGVIAVITLLMQKTDEMNKKMLEESNISKLTTNTQISDAQRAGDAILSTWGLNEKAINSFSTAHTTATGTVVENINKISEASKNATVIPGLTSNGTPVITQSSYADSGKHMQSYQDQYTFNKLAYNGPEMITRTPGPEHAPDTGGNAFFATPKVDGDGAVPVKPNTGGSWQENLGNGIVNGLKTILPSPAQTAPTSNLSTSDRIDLLGLRFGGDTGAAKLTALQELYSGTYGTGGYNAAEEDVRRSQIARGVYTPSGIVSPDKGFGAQPQVVAPPISGYQVANAISARAAEQGLAATMAGQIGLGSLGTFPVKGLITGPEYQEIQNLKAQAEEIKAKVPVDKATGMTDWKGHTAEAQQYIATLQKIVGVTSSMNDEDRQAAADKAALDEKIQGAEKSLSEYNGIVMKMPTALREATGMELQLSTTVQDGSTIYTVYDQELIKHIDLTRRQAAGYTSLSAIQKESLGVQEQVVAVGNEIVGGQEQQANKIKATKIFWDQLNPAMAQNIQMNQEIAFSNIDVTSSLTNLNKNQYLVGQGYIQGKLAAQQFLDSTIQGAVQNREYTQSLFEIANTLQFDVGHTLADIIPADAELSSKELETLIANFIETGKAGETLANIMNSRVAESFKTLDGVIHAENFKQFKEEFKKFDFGTLGKDATKQFKEMDMDFNKVAKSGKVMGDIIDHIIAGLSSGHLDNSALRQGLEAINDAIDKLKKSDVDAKFLTPYEEFVDSLGKGERTLFLTQHADAIKYLATAVSDGDLTPTEVLAFYEKLGVKFDTTGQNADSLKKSLSDLKQEMKVDKFNLQSFQKSGDISSGMEIEDQNRLQGNPLSTPGKGPSLAEIKAQAKKDAESQLANKPEQQKMLDELNKNVPAAAQKAQTALANLANQGGNSMRLLANNILKNTQNLIPNFKTIDVAAQGTQTALGNLSIQGGNSFRILANLILKNTNNLLPNFTSIDVAAQGSQTAILNLEEQGSNSMSLLVKNIRPHIVTLNTYFGTTIPKAIDASIAAFDDFNNAADDVGSAADDLAGKLKDLAKAYIAVAAAAKKARAATGGGSGGSGGGTDRAQFGMHTTLNEDSLIMAHRGERVDIDTVGATQSNAQKIRGSGGVTVINLEVVSNTNLDGEKIGSNVTRRTFRKMSTR